MHEETQILHKTHDRDPATGALSVPIYPASTYHQADVDANQEFQYVRSGNPTRAALEATLAGLENGTHAYAFASGMAAISAALMAVLSQGDHVVASRHLYGGSYRFLTSFINRFGVECSFADTSDADAVRAAWKPNTRVLFLETPSNPLLKITDLKAMAAIARERGAVSMLDNTFLTPFLCKPLDLGIDVSIHSCTKFLGGHSDLLAGAVMVKDDALAKKIYAVQNACGGVLPPQDSWLLLRGIKTLAPRMKTSEISAAALAVWLKSQPWVTDVYYPGLADHPGHAILKTQASGFGAVLSFACDTVERVRAIMKKVKILTVAVSLGGVESILSYPAKMSHAAMPESERHAQGIPDTLLRLSVGLEHAEDIIEDLRQAAE